MAAFRASEPIDAANHSPEQPGRGRVLRVSVEAIGIGYGKIVGMAESESERRSRLREDLSKEYYALFDAISNYDGRLLIVKGWSVTLSLAALGLAFQQRHYALFLLAAVTGAAFWLLDGLMKGFQYRY